MARFHQALLIGSSLLLAWLLMQAVHELGHILAACMTGGTVTKVVLHPLAISRTDVEPNPRPLAVAWSGPVFGSIVPLIFWAVAEAMRRPTRFWWRFCCGFCLIANGLYIAVGSFRAIGDAGDILRLGSPIWLLWLFGLITAPAGLALWDGLGPAFGIGPQAAAIPAKLGYTLAGWLVLVLLVEFTFFSAR